MDQQSKSLADKFKTKRTYRKFTQKAVLKQTIENCIKVALRAPSGANQQPWTFCVVSNDILKQKIRQSSEDEERKFYDKESLGEWHQELEHLKVNTEKPFLTEAQYLICIFYHKVTVDGKMTYYASKSTGIASGMLISALHLVGLNSITYTPQNMKFLHTLLNRPDNEAPYLILAVGEKDINYELPNITKKPLNEAIIYY